MSPEALTQGRRRSSRFALIATMLLGLEACISVGLVRASPTPRTPAPPFRNFEVRLSDAPAATCSIRALGPKTPWPNTPAGSHQ